MANIKSAKKRIITTAAAFENAKSIIDRAASKGVLHKNTAARKVSRLAAAVKKAQ